MSPSRHDAASATPALDLRTVSEAEFGDWLKAVSTGFLRPPVVGENDLVNRLANSDLARTQGVFDNGRCVATFRSFAQELTVVGGAAVPTSAVTNVTVSPTHRRRGLLSKMMANDLAAAKKRGEVAATLIAAEYPIYGRYGFGPATWTAEWEVDTGRSGLDPRWSGPQDGARIELADSEDVRKLGPDLFERFRAGQPGAVSRNARWWDLNTGAVRRDDQPWTEPFWAVYRSAAGEVEGLAAYHADETWTDAKQPLNTATVRGLLGLTPAAERALWHFICSVDWITKVRTGYRAPDDLLPLLLPDPRAARMVTHADFLWLRVLDVVRALEARTYASSGTLVLEVTDASGLASGRYRLDADASGAVCAPTAERADLALDVRELGTLYLGDESAVRLAALGLAAEETAGAAARADALLRTSRRAWCPDMF
ncbi:GNAT family N-acetyltransferase [Streptomyces sp. BPTC-684]|uniref:GNAT family N-acetyltransferase n=1 Tax=Streptomyces sp. BPTC-684 TaxID=3043734 RepID=UPI0024B103B1|nr:GNAT family N-acetyltransferase [Streptomyces sp. BPTC-684]WHM38036.1 GNAT family N-acetyltransferase [Streptomyces sp. BPTC-684]